MATTGTTKEVLEVPADRPAARATRMHRPLHGDPQALLATKPILRKARFGASFSVTVKVKFTDGTTAVFKPEPPPCDWLTENFPGGLWQREVVAYDVARLTGLDDLVPVTTVREIDGVTGSLQAWVKGSPPKGPRLAPTWRGTSPEDLRRAVAFDYAIGNLDRHAGNWLVRKDGKLALIDHGFTLPGNRGDVDTALRQPWSARETRAAIPESIQATWRSARPGAVAAMRARGLGEETIGLFEDRVKRLTKPGMTWRKLFGD